MQCNAQSESLWRWSDGRLWTDHWSPNYDSKDPKASAIGPQQVPVRALLAPPRDLPRCSLVLGKRQRCMPLTVCVVGERCRLVWSLLPLEVSRRSLPIDEQFKNRKLPVLAVRFSSPLFWPPCRKQCSPILAVPLNFERNLLGRHFYEGSWRHLKNSTASRASKQFVNIFHFATGPIKAKETCIEVIG